MKLFIQKFAANFKPTFWSKYCQTELAKDLVIANWCDYKFEGEIQHGKRLEIVGAVRPTVKKYTEGTDIEIETLGDTIQHLDIEYADYFAFYVDDIEKAQSTPGYLDTQFNEAKKTLANALDGLKRKEKNMVKDRIEELESLIKALEADSNEELEIKPGDGADVVTKEAIYKSAIDRKASLEMVEEALVAMDNQSKVAPYCPVY